MVKLSLSFSLAVRAAVTAILVVTQAGCITSALMKLGEGSGVPTEQPVRYTGAIRYGNVLALQYIESLDHHGNVSTGIFRDRVNLTDAAWQRFGAAPMDPYCHPSMWARILPSTPSQPVPVINGRSGDLAQLASLHRARATGFPPMTVHLEGLDAWILCGADDRIGYTMVPAPPEPESGHRSAGAVAAIIVLFPFALTADIAFGAFYAIGYLIVHTK